MTSDGKWIGGETGWEVELSSPSWGDLPDLITDEACGILNTTKKGYFVLSVTNDCESQHYAVCIIRGDGRHKQTFYTLHVFLDVGTSN